jgi:GDP-L-fucose synthase
MKKILILGANGLVGSSIDYGIKLGRKEVDLLNYNQTLDVIKYYKPDAIINCAGEVGGVKANMDYKFDFFKNNMLINMNVIEASMKADVPNLISFLSTCIFPENLAKKGKLLIESDLHLGEPHESNYPYAYSKRMIQVLSQIARERGFNYQNIIPCNLYGLKDNYNLEKSHLIPALIRKFYQASKDSNYQIEIWGDGTPIREFIFANDISKIVEIILLNNFKFNEMIISPNQRYSINEIVMILESIVLKKQHNYFFDKTKPNGQKQKNTNNQKFKDFCNKFSFELTPLRNGLEQTFDYFSMTFENNPQELKL